MACDDERLGSVPPLPLLQECVALMRFWCESLDDCLEDVTKLLLLFVALSVSWRINTQCLRSRVLGHAVIGTFLLLAYPLIDDISNRAGALAVPLQAVSCALFPCTMQHRGRLSNRAGTCNLVDEIVEDTSKLLCVASHAYVGLLLRTAVVHGPAAIPSPMRSVAGLIVAAGAPAAQYHACDEWSDALGDFAEQWASRLMSRGTTEAHPQEGAIRVRHAHRWWLPWTRKSN